jgi:hypothetical protein
MEKVVMSFESISHADQEFAGKITRLMSDNAQNIYTKTYMTKNCWVSVKKMMCPGVNLNLFTKQITFKRSKKN